MNSIFISEIKTCSPFGFKSNYTFEELYSIANEHGDIISVHTNPLWGGSMESIKSVRMKTNKSILAKGLHETDKEILEALSNGANFVLVVGRVPSTHMLRTGNIWIEPNSLEQLKMIPPDVVAVWNSRNLSDGSFKKETWEQARAIFNGTLVQASNIRKLSDVKTDAQAYIVGEHLTEFIKSK